jgi:hypothetical protein
MNDVCLISLVEEGYTIGTVTKTLQRHNSVFTSCTRRWYCEDREKTVDFVTEITRSVIGIHNQKLLDRSNDLKSLAEGLSNLAKTYKEDKPIVTRIVNLSNSISDALQSQSQSVYLNITNY